MNTIPSYKEWRETQQWPNSSFDHYKFAFALAEYQVFRLDPNTKLSHIEGEAPLLNTDSLADACGFIHKAYHEQGLELCIWHERSEGYRDFYRKRQKRDSNGRFMTGQE